MTELLAPVGSVQALDTAIVCGADAVYLGLDCFNARMKADNFTRENIAYYTTLCHLHGVKVYVAFNTSIKTKELPIIAEYIEAAAKADVDAFIVTDLGALEEYRKYDIPLHASTQMGVHNAEGALLLKRLGFTRVVLARETLEEDIIRIKQQSDLEIEYFVHGALCVGFSGGCLLSSMMSGDSGNRGRCNQPCRQLYRSDFDPTPRYLLSPADQCLVSKLSRLVACGVDSFKIEGRLKQPHYVGEVLTQYRKVLASSDPEQADLHLLKRAYNRGGFTLGYHYDGTNKLMSPDLQGHRGDLIGKIVSERKGEIAVRTNASLQEGDGVKVLANRRELGGFAIQSVRRSGSVLLIRCDKRYPIGSDVYLTLDSDQVRRFASCRPSVRVNLSASLRIGHPAELTLSAVGHTVTVVGDVVQAAQSRQLTKEDIVKQLDRLGGTYYEAGRIDAEGEEGCFYPLSALNRLRRDGLEELTRKILAEYDRTKQRVKYADYPSRIVSDCRSVLSDKRIYAQIQTADQPGDWCKDAIIILDPIDFNLDSLNILLKNQTIENTLKSREIKIFLRLPKLMRGKDRLKVEECVRAIDDLPIGIACENLYAVQTALQHGKPALGLCGLNLYNSRAAAVYGLHRFVASPELNREELSEFSPALAAVYAYGKLAVMTLSHCPVQLATKCACSDCRYTGSFCYRDQKAEYLLVRRRAAHCYFDLHNPQTVDLRGKIKQRSYQIYANMLECNQEQIERIIADFIGDRGLSEPNATSGHFLRGVK